MTVNLSQIFDNYADSVFRAAYKICGNREDAKDVTQEVFLKVKNMNGTLANVKNVKAYLIKMAVNNALNLKRKETVKLNFENDQINTKDNNTEDVIELNNKTNALKFALENISDKQREAVTHRFFSDMTIEQVAQAMDITVSSVRVHLVRALKQLRILLNNKLDKELL